MSGKGSKWPRTLPEHSTATFAQLMLLHQAGWPNHLMWEHWQDAHAPGSLTMFVHMKVRTRQRGNMHTQTCMCTHTHTQSVHTVQAVMPRSVEKWEGLLLLLLEDGLSAPLWLH